MQLYTEDLEQRNKSDSAGTNTATPGAMSKSKAAPKTATYPEPKEKTPTSSPCTTPRSEAWEMLEETAHQNDRISNIEGALSQIAQQLQFLTAHLNVESTLQ